MLNICKLLFDSWNSNDIKYCHWKSNEHLMEGLTGITDLDVFVHPQHKEKAKQLLNDTGYLMFKPQVSARYPNVEEFIGFDYETGKLVHVHLHFQIITGTKFCKEYVFPIDDIIISTREKDAYTGVFVIDPSLELIILLSRIVLKSEDKKHIVIDHDYLHEIKYLKERVCDEKLRYYCHKLIQYNGNEFYAYAIADNLTQDDLYKLYVIVKKWLKPYKKYSSVYTFLRHKYFKTKNILTQVLNKKFGLHIINKKTFQGSIYSVCFIGQDGSGKSTIAQDICKWLNWKISAERFYLGSGDHYNSLLKKLLEKTMRQSLIRKKDGNTEPINKRQVDQKWIKQKQSFLKRLVLSVWNILRVRYLCVIAHRSYREIRKSIKYMRKGGIAVYDRFPQIQFQGLYDGPKIKYQFIDKGIVNAFIRYYSKKEEEWLIKAQKYQPTLIFKLILPPEESIRRKPFEDYDAIVRKSKITEQLHFDNSMVYDIDACQEYDKELLIIKQIIWKHLTERCK